MPAYLLYPHVSELNDSTLWARMSVYRNKQTFVPGYTRTLVFLLGLTLSDFKENEQEGCKKNVEDSTKA